MDKKLAVLLDEHVLCYVRGNVATFTNISLEYQWGDDWNDAPYEHNAGDPYQWHSHDDLPQYTLLDVMFQVGMETPADIANGNSAYSVEQINKRYTPWLKPWHAYPTAEPIFAGVTVSEFKRLIWANGGDVFERVSRPEEQTQKEPQP